ncbi:MAG: ABC transporter ATP-binding protein [Lachnospiraceae bacterium]|nr:ABC transporter ATP-binding protein [Lachnospiraceae bacterium]
MNKEILVEGLTKTYNVTTNIQTVLDNVDLCIYKGELVALMGASGCGKTTLLKILSGMSEPTKGDVYLRGERVDYSSKKKRLSIRREIVSYIPQTYSLIDEKTIFENTIISVRKKEYKENYYEKVYDILEYLGLDNKAESFPPFLSSGEKQRVTIARALVDDKEIILADEPTGSLDEKNAQNVVWRLKSLAHEYGKTIIMATHDEEMANMCDRKIYMSYGKIKEEK